MIIRRSMPDDFDALVELDWSSAIHHVGLDPEYYRLPDREASAAFLRQRLADPNREVLVAVVDRIVAGMVDVTLVDDPAPGSIIRSVPTADIGISVLEPCRRRGIGRALMAAAEASARERGARRMVLDISAANADALRFYRSLGYLESGLVLRRALK
jgi:ribosomal protein S18 acetylase RimI-like enzyme